MSALPMYGVIVILILAAFEPIAAGGQPPSSTLARAAAEREAALARSIAAAPTDPLAYFALARFQEEFGAFAEAEATLLKARQALATNKDVALELHAFYRRRNQLEKALAMLRILARLDPADISLQLEIADAYGEKAKKAHTAQRGAYIREGIAATDRALAIAPDHLAAIASKVLLLRLSAEFISDPRKKSRIMDEAAALLIRGMALARENEAPPSR